MLGPKNLILVRHGRSEGNSVNSKFRKSKNNELFTQEFLDRHESEYRLTEQGVRQAKEAGDWLAHHFNETFDRAYVSTHKRALETAVHLGLSEDWMKDFRLRERDGGLFNTISPKERDELFKHEQKHAKEYPFLWRPPQGESIADVTLRMKSVIETLYREFEGKNVIIVNHGHVIRAFRILLERVQNYDELCSNQGEYAVHNCSIWHYTRQNPENQTGRLSSNLNWVRTIDPTTDYNQHVGEWKTIVRKKYTNEELLREVEKIARLKK